MKFTASGNLLSYSLSQEEVKQGSLQQEELIKDDLE